MTIQRNCNCDNELFQNFKNSFVRLPSSTGSEQAFDKLRASWLSLTLDFKPYVTLSFCRSVTLSFFKISKILLSVFDKLRLTINLKSFVTLSFCRSVTLSFFKISSILSSVFLLRQAQNKLSTSSGQVGSD